MSPESILIAKSVRTLKGNAEIQHELAEFTQTPESLKDESTLCILRHILTSFPEEVRDDVICDFVPVLSAKSVFSYTVCINKFTADF